jgi:peptide/nickel transport system substrate-binding protein
VRARSTRIDQAIAVVISDARGATRRDGQIEDDQMALTHRSLTRRSLIRGAGIGTLGLAGAAVLGCGGDDDGTSGAGAPKSSAPVTSSTGVETLPLTAPVAQGRPRKGGTYTMSTGAITFAQHDAHTALGPNEWHVIGEKLIESNFTDAKLLPHVAMSWEVADPKGLTLVFKLKPGIKIHNVPPWNGREFTAEDVAWNLERIGALYADRLNLPKAAFQRASMVQNITKAEAVDKHTVKVTLSAPNSGFFAGVSENRTPLMPKEMDDIGFNDPIKFGGIGPFQIAEFKKDQIQRFKAFREYESFRPGEPSFDETVIQTVPDRTSLLAAFTSNQVQVVTGLNEQEQGLVKRGRPDALHYEWIDCNWNHVRPSMDYAPFKDFRVRQAIHLALDYAAIGNGVYGSGWGYQAALTPGYQEAWKPNKVRSLPGYNPDTKEEDRAEGLKMMEAAGYPKGKGLEFDVMYITTADFLKENATRFQAQMQANFPDAKVTHRPVDSPIFASQQAAGEFKSLSYVITAVPDPVLEMISQYRTGGSRNYGKFSEPALDAILDKALAELNPQARTQLLEDFQTNWVNEWRPMYVLHANAVRNALQSNIAGYDKLAGTWFGYSWYTKICRMTYLDK